MRKNPKQKELEKHKGCKDCTKNCVFNRVVTTKEKNASSGDLKYGCNSSKRRK